MKVQAENVTPVKIKLTIEVEAEEFTQEENKAANQIRRSVSIPGFRKGKAPAETVKRLYGDQVRSEAFSAVIQSTYTAAVREQELWPVDDPDIQVDKAEEDGSMAYTAIVEIRPEVTATGYTGLELKREEMKVDQAEVEARLETLRQQAATFEPADEGHKAESGDMVVIDFEGSVDGELFEGGAAQGHSLQLGSGRMIPGFEEGIAGAAAGEERTVEVTFPEEYPAENLSGKAASFAITVQEVKCQVLPELDDEFAKTAGQVETLDEFKKLIAEVVESEQKNRIESEFRRKVTDILLEANPFEVPEALVKRQQEHSMERMKSDMAMRGMDPAAAGLDDPKFAEEARAAAERSVRWAFLLDAIAAAEGVEVGDADVDERLAAIAQSDGRPVEAIRGFFEKEEHMDSLRNSIREQKTFDAILSSAKVDEVDTEKWAEWRGEE